MIDYLKTGKGEMCENICYNLDNNFYCGNCCNVQWIFHHVPSIYRI